VSRYAAFAALVATLGREAVRRRRLGPYARHSPATRALQMRGDIPLVPGYRCDEAKVLACDWWRARIVTAKPHAGGLWCA